jgi:RimJ/RimL family protein N-acetyltransferase
MQWPLDLPAQLHAGTVSVTRYRRADATELYERLSDDRVWQHMSRGAPADAAALDQVIRSRLAGGCQVTFTVRHSERAVGITSVLFNRDDPAGAEIGGTLLDPGVWGTGVNSAVKQLLLTVVFDHGAEWVQLRTDERNGRSVAAILKLGATEVASCREQVPRRDGTTRRSRIFRIDNPGRSMLG